MSMNYKNQGKTIRRLRRMIPDMKCPQGCTDCCGPVMFSEWERDRIKLKKPLSGIDCQYIADGGCGIYEQRPIVCRLFGAIKKLKCPRGCEPEEALDPTTERLITITYISTRPTLTEPTK